MKRIADSKKAIEKAKRGEKLTADERRAIIRDYMLEYPRIERYGYNKALIKFFRDNFKVNIGTDVISQDIANINDQMMNSKAVLYSKEKVIKMYERIAEKAIKPELKIAILKEIAKIEGISKDNVAVAVSGGITDINTIAELEEIKKQLEAEKAEKGKKG